MLSCRHDLIPNSVETVKAAGYERQTLENAVAARHAAVAVRGNAGQLSQAEGSRSAARQLFAVAEAYSDLK